MKKFYSLLIALLCSATMAFAYEAQIDGVYYDFDHWNNTATVTYDEDYSDDNGAGYTQSEIIIPEKVTFDGEEYSVTSIGRGAFNGCSSLTSITIPNRVTSIGKSAFKDCSSLTSITIPNRVTSIGGSAFYGCLSLTSIDVETNNQNYASIDGVLYNKEITTLICYPAGKTSITILNSVTSIGESAFAGCSSLTSITIPNSVTSIGEDAFYGCSSLTSITIPNSVTSIGEYTFSGCSSLTSITIPNSVTSIGEYTFEGCSSLTSITIPNSVTSIGESAFSGCSSLTSVQWNVTKCSDFDYSSRPFYNCEQITSFTFGDNVEHIPAYLCYKMSKLTSITIPNSVTSIGGSAFERCSSLTSITIPNSVTSIGGSAFEGCSSLTSITIPNSVTEIGSEAFSGTPWLENQSDGCVYINNCLYMYKGEMSVNTHIDVKEGTTRICDYAFYGCSSLTSITIPNSVTSIGESAFSGCSSLTSITIPNSVTSIGDYAFEGCSSLTSIAIPNSVTSIGEDAFVGCSSLTAIHWNIKNLNDFSGFSSSFFYDIRNQITSFTFGDSVEHIPAYLCCGMNNLTSIAIPNSVTSIGDYAFSGCSSLTSIAIPNSVTSIGESAFSGCSSLTSIAIPNSVTSIGESAFASCSLTSITIPNSVTSIGELVFYGCSSLTSVQWNVKKCSDFDYRRSPFYGCEQITSFTFGDSVEHIPAYLCYGMNNLTSVSIGNSVTSIGDCAFSGCSSLTAIHWNIKKLNDFSGSSSSFFYNIRNQITSFTFGDSVEHIPAYLCYDMDELTSITISNSVTSIGKQAFYDCNKVRTLNIGSAIESIGVYAFEDCSAIYSIDIDAIVPPIISSSTFNNVSRTMQIKVPCGAMAAYQASSYWNEFTNYMESPYTLSVEVNDNTMGMAVVTKQNTCTDIIATVQAQARPGYEFVKWSDGFTENPHTVFVMEDMAITAEFAPMPKEYNVSVVCDVTMGTVTGSGTYKEGESVTIEAIANEGYHFVEWSDGNIENPRTIVVTEDVELMAEFEEDDKTMDYNVDESSVIVYVQNGMIYIEGVGADYHVLDAAGRLIYTGRDAQLQLPRGVYMVAIGGEVQKVVL